MGVEPEQGGAAAWVMGEAGDVVGKGGRVKAGHDGTRQGQELGLGVGRGEGSWLVYKCMGKLCSVFF